MTAPSEPLTPGLEDLDRPLTDRERRRYLLKPVLGTPFDDTDRLFPSFETSGVFDRGQEDAGDLKQMLRRDGRVRQLENVLTLPVRSAGPPEFRERKGTGAKGKKAAEMCEQAFGKWTRPLIAQGSSAVIFRKAFFEIEWQATDYGVGPKDIAWRPPATCQARYDPRTGKPAGFRQQVVTPDGKLLVAPGDELPGWKIVPQPRALIFTHGTHREPITGTSELDAAYWCWENRQKVLYLLFRYLETQALPKLGAFGSSPTEAQQNADYLADAVSSAVIPMVRQNGSTDTPYSVIESSGKGADQFLAAVRYLEEQQVQSVLAGFLQLTELGKTGGSYALGSDARQFFTQSRQADADEQGQQLQDDACARVTAYNLGDPDLVDVAMPKLSDTETGRALELLTTLATASTVNAPMEFVDELLISTATYLGQDPDKVKEYVEEHAKQRKEREEQMADVAAAGGDPAGEGPGGTSPPPGTKPTGQAKQRKTIGDDVDAVFELVRRVELGQEPRDALATITGRRRGPNPEGPIDMARQPGAPNYAGTARTALLDALGDRAEGMDERMIDVYALLVLTRGEDTTLRDVHDAWAVWRHKSDPDHRSLIPFEELEQNVQELDEPYRAAIAEAARSLAGGPAPSTE